MTSVLVLAIIVFVLLGAGFAWYRHSAARRQDKRDRYFKYSFDDSKPMEGPSAATRADGEA